MVPPITGEPTSVTMAVCDLVAARLGLLGNASPIKMIDVAESQLSIFFIIAPVIYLKTISFLALNTQLVLFGY